MQKADVLIYSWNVNCRYLRLAVSVVCLWWILNLFLYIKKTPATYIPVYLRLWNIRKLFPLEISITIISITNQLQIIKELYLLMYISFSVGMTWEKEKPTSNVFGMASVIKLPGCGCIVHYVNVLFVGVFNFGCGGSN